MEWKTLTWYVFQLFIQTTHQQNTLGVFLSSFLWFTIYSGVRFYTLRWTCFWIQSQTPIIVTAQSKLFHLNTSQTKWESKLSLITLEKTKKQACLPTPRAPLPPLRNIASAGSLLNSLNSSREGRGTLDWSFNSKIN